MKKSVKTLNTLNILNILTLQENEGHWTTL